MTEKLLEAAAKHSGGKLVSTLEGGYDLDALAGSTAVHVQDPDGRLLRLAS